MNKEIKGTIALVVSICVLFFGNNWVEQSTGKSIFAWISDSLKQTNNSPSLPLESDNTSASITITSSVPSATMPVSPTLSVTLTTVTPSVTLLAPKETWKQEGMELTPVKDEFSENKLRIWWEIKNNTSQDRLVVYSHENFKAETNTERELTVGVFEGGGLSCRGEERKLLKPGQTLELCHTPSFGGLPMSVSVDLAMPDLEYIIVTASDISRVEKAQWKFPASFR